MNSRFFTAAGIMLGTLLAASSWVRGSVPDLLDDAVQKVARDTDRWAYTQEVVEKDPKGKTINTAVVRFDPSKPYAEQYAPITIDGKAPSAADLKLYRKKGERRGKSAAKQEQEGTNRVNKTVGELMDMDHAIIAEEDSQSVTYEVPLKKEGNTRFPPEKFRILARVGKASGAFERIEARLREPMRTALIVKIKSGEASLDFSQIDPKFAPTPVAARGVGSYSILMIPGGRDYEVKRSDFKRVKPYGDNFGVEIGPMKAIDF
jgi:hypothetical protein